MNKKDIKYQKFGLSEDMMNTVRLIEDFSENQISEFFMQIGHRKKFFISGEGSSRIFPAKNVICRMMKHLSGIDVKTEGANQSMEYCLTEHVVIGLSNSGKTKELIRLFSKLKEVDGHKALFGITTYNDSPLTTIANESITLKCGAEKSVAATVSVIEQALLLDVLFCKIIHIPVPPFKNLASKLQSTLSIEIEEDIIGSVVNASILYFAGRNNGVAEELTLKTNEILRKRSDYLEGTYAVHGIEEVMTSNDVIILIEPDEEEEPVFNKYLSEAVGLQIVAISSRQTMFKTILIPESGFYATYLQLAAGWNLLLECGLKLDINLDKPERARKIGNEFQ